MFPLPDGLAQPAPAEAAHVHDVNVTPAGATSATDAPITFDGPLFVTTTVYVVVVPGVAVGEPSVLVIVRSATPTIASTSEAELSAGFGSVTPAGGTTVAVLVSTPVAAGSRPTTTVNVIDEPAARLTTVAIAPEPDGAHDAPAVAAHVQLIVVAPVGIASATDAPKTLDGPLLATTTV